MSYDFGGVVHVAPIDMRDGGSAGAVDFDRRGGVEAPQVMSRSAAVRDVTVR
jgi:hypothetical protein